MEILLLNINMAGGEQEDQSEVGPNTIYLFYAAYKGIARGTSANVSCRCFNVASKNSEKTQHSRQRERERAEREGARHSYRVSWSQRVDCLRCGKLVHLKAYGRPQQRRELYRGRKRSVYCSNTELFIRSFTELEGRVRVWS